MQKPYSIAMSMKYEDGNATQFESASSLAIPVKQAARFELSDIEVAPESVAVGEEANITCSLYNTGRIKLYNVKAKFEGEGLTGKEVFVGNIEPGATGSIDGIVTANQEMDETKKCKVVILMKMKPERVRVWRRISSDSNTCTESCGYDAGGGRSTGKRTSGCSDRDRGCCGGRNCYSCAAAQT